MPRAPIEFGLDRDDGDHHIDWPTHAEVMYTVITCSRSTNFPTHPNRPLPLIPSDHSTIGCGPWTRSEHEQASISEPWHFVAVSDQDVKRRIREAAETEERTSYIDGRMNNEWQNAFAHLGTDWHKEFLEVAGSPQECSSLPFTTWVW